jgi:hypothetical protein
MPEGTRSEALAAQAKFVFQGTVQQVRATTMREVPVADNTVVVRVDRLIHAPEALTDYAGQEITVQLAAGENVEAGQTYIFYTNGWVFGDSLAVQSIGHEAATAPAVASLSSHPDDPVRSLETREALTQVTNADLIVTGTVSAVRLPEEELAARSTAMASGRTTEPISEHALFWQEAVIDIDEVIKGSHTAKQVVVRFPSSTDVRWYQAPKFQAGQDGVFLLHKEQLEVAAPAALAAGVGPGEYQAIHPADVQPLEELSRIRLAVQARNR